MKNKTTTHKKTKRFNKASSDGVDGHSSDSRFKALLDEMYTDSAHRRMRSFFQAGIIKKASIEPLTGRILMTPIVGESSAGTLLAFAKMATLYAGKISLDLFSPHVVEFFSMIEDGLKKDGRMKEVDRLCPRLLVECQKFNDETVLHVLTHLVIFKFIEMIEFQEHE